MENLRILTKCIFGPRLHSFYKLTGHTISSTTPEVLSRNHRYQLNPVESFSDYVIRVTKIITSFGAYISPILFTYLVYKRNVPGALVNSLDNNVMLKLFTAAIGIFIGSYCLRGLARYSSPEYLAFLRVLDEVSKNPSPSNKRILVHFDADFSAFPIDFRWSEARDKRPPAPYVKSYPTQVNTTPTLILDNFILRWPLELILSGVMKTVGRRLIYPGSLSFLQAIMSSAISAGRAKLIQDYDGIRHKLESYDGNAIDTMFVDSRGLTPNGDYLVIGCEGNGGFYEIGTILTPLEAGYSVLGWNHPGFGGSTGIPNPDQEVAAVDTVVKFAMDKLSFAPSQIIMYGWSIGGFTATWAGMRYPNIRGLVIDASFDHILPIARNIVPKVLFPIVELAIKQNFDLDNVRHMEHFKGPVLFIRRSQDEVIATDPYNSPATNRANDLLSQVLKQRFPNLIDSRAIAILREYLDGGEAYQKNILRQYSVNNTNCYKLLLDYFHTNPTSYPVSIGPELDNTTRDQLVLYLAYKYMIDYDSVHCAPLSPRYFSKPWNLIGTAMDCSNL